MRPRLFGFVFAGLLGAMLATASPSVFAGQLLNYQFETVDGVVPNQTTPDATGNFVSSNNGTDPVVNAMVGYGTNTPGTDYPQLALGPVANATKQSLNPNNYMSFYSTVLGGSRNNYTQVNTNAAAVGTLGTTLNTTFTNFTVALWLNPTSQDLDRFAIGKMGANGQRGWQIAALNGTNDLSIDYFSTVSNGSDRSLQVANVLPLNTWTHVAFTFDGTAGTEAIYINGVLQTPVTTLSSLATPPAVLNGANTSAFKVGHRGGTATAVGGWIGGIDDVRIYDQTLTAAEVQALMAPVTPSVTGDFDNDGDVDGADFIVWQTHFPTASGGSKATGDANGDGAVDAVDFGLWQSHFPTSPGSVAAVPEPSAYILLAIGGLAGLMCRARGLWKAK